MPVKKIARSASAKKSPPPTPITPTVKSSHGMINVRGVRQNNLKGFDLDLPLGQLIVVTGPSGSGKSSLAFDTIYAEGQRRYIETFSPYVRQFFERMDKPNVDDIRGIPPAIAIEQANQVRTTRSTVGTMTEINDYLKLLFPRLASARCPKCHEPVRPDTPQVVVAQLLDAWRGQDVLVSFPISVPAKTEVADFFSFLHAQGYLRAWIYGQVWRLDEPAAYEKKSLPARVLVIQDRIKIEPSATARLTEAVEQAFHFGQGQVSVIEARTGKMQSFSRGWHCARCDVTLREPTPALFSFNSPVGACPVCRGFGRVIAIDLRRAMPDHSLSIRAGVVRAFQGDTMGESQLDLMKAAKARGLDVDCPFEELSERDQKWVIDGEIKGETLDDMLAGWQAGLWYGVKGFFKWLETRAYKMHVRVFLSRYRAYTECLSCGGGRLQPEALNFRVDEHTLPDWWRLPVTELAAIMAALEKKIPAHDTTAAMLRTEIETRLRYLDRVGLGYLTLDRSARTLSGGEIQRVNLTSCLGANLVNTLFVMDEPSVGLHPRDIGRMIEVMHDLRDKGNTLLVVEHEESVIRAADQLVDIGPGRGQHGGELIYQGLSTVPASVAPRSLTLAYLSGEKSIPVPKQRRAISPSRVLKVTGARQHNLRKLNVTVPLGLMVVLTGVSGSGKSTLVHDIIYENLLRQKGGSSEQEPGVVKSITGAELINEVILVDQAPLTRTRRSAPALYLGVFDSIRQLFAATPEAKEQGYTASFFSFNSGHGRCTRCQGAGFEKVEMQFLSDLFVKCPSCDGRRYGAAALSVLVEGKSVADVLEMTIAEAIVWLQPLAPASAAKLQYLADVGLDYLYLGQPLNTLSGGESQRLKLVAHLVEKGVKKSKRGDLLIFDEPTTGLHFDDIRLMLDLFQKLVDCGHSLIIIEHNLEVIAAADWVIDLGPEAGAAGGQIVAEGTPEQVAKVEGSHTGAYLRRHLAGQRTVMAKPTAVPEQATSAGIRIHGAREHNLKNLHLEIPRDQFVVLTGLSGSGKSTLAFDILFAEGQRRFLDSMSTYARQFAEQLERPAVDHITGLPPTVAIEQRLTRGGGKSTVGTVTEVYHFLRLLFAKVGVQHCPDCGVPVRAQTLQEITASLCKELKKGPHKIMATVVKGRKGFHDEVAQWAARHGYHEMLVDGVLIESAAFKRLERFKEHTIDVVIATLDADFRRADVEMIIEAALSVGKGSIRVMPAGKKSAAGNLTVYSAEMTCPECGRSFEPLDPRLFSFNSPHGWCEDCRGFGFTPQRVIIKPDRPDESQLEAELREEMSFRAVELGEDEEDTGPPPVCPTCNGHRINEIGQAVRVCAQTIGELTRLTVYQLSEVMRRFTFSGRDEVIARDILVEIRQRLHFMEKVGLGYLQLDRSASTLSGGESQRIRLAAQLGSNLRGVLYILDEPTIGLHPRDNQRLLDTLTALRDQGNSVIVVEHDEETMQRADHVIDLGPGAGRFGGEVVAEGRLADITANEASPTGRAFRAAMTHPLRGQRRPVAAKTKKQSSSKKTTTSEPETAWLTLTGCSVNNLRDLTIRIPRQRLTVITGVSGSGKSSFMRGVLHPAVKAALTGGKKKITHPGKSPTWKKVEGAEAFDAVYEVDQSPIGKSSRSCPATYIGLFDAIRQLMASLPAARMRGYTASRFSFNTEGGRCETCKGQGQVKLEMAFLPSSYIPCEDCHGLRYNRATLEIEYREKNIGQIMQMSIDEAAEFFAAVPSISRPLQLLRDTGVGYLSLGQASPSLSGGEAQRLKLVTELTRGVNRSLNDRLRRAKSPQGSLYLIEEPTIGLHLTDVRKLIEVLHRLVDDGHTVVVIEHHLDLAAEADWILDFGPEAGAEGGRLVAEGTPEDIARHKTSRTAPFLKAVLAR